MTTITDARRPFVPGMGVDWLLPLYDPLTKLIGLDRARRDLIVQADLQPGHRVLDIGCGTGTLALQIKRLFRDVDVAGVDPDERALARAARKARRAGLVIQFQRGFSDALEYGAGSVDRVFSSFMFHHLGRQEKERTLHEVWRVLRSTGNLHLLDFDGPDSDGNGSRWPRLGSHHRLQDNDQRTIVALLREAGFAEARTVSNGTVMGGTVRIVYYRAQREVL